MKVKVLFLGFLADISGTGVKFYRDVITLENLKLRVADDFPEFVHYQFNVSLNNEIKDADAVLKDNDEVVFLPLSDGE